MTLYIGGVRIFDLWLTSSGGSSSSESSSSSSESSSSSSESSSSSSESSSSSSESSSSSSESSSSASSITPSWTAAACDIFGTTGNVPSGSVTTATETQVVFAATGGNVNSSNRRFYFVYTPVTGDFTFTARVVSVTGSFTVANNAYRYGLLFCENDLSVKTAYTDVRRFAENGFYTLTTTPTFQGSRAYKLDVGSGSTQSRTNTVANVGDYLRLVRSGNSVSCYYSTDGVNFTLLNTSSFANANGNPISDTMYVGFFAAPGADNLTFAYDNIVITQP